jgi:tetratricopeptide (TPR) repeat protein
LALEHVQSEHSHYSSFMCKICNELVANDAIVTVRCNHLFCRSCFDDWAAKSTACPACNIPIDGASNDKKCSSCRKFSAPSGMNVVSLQLSQPLAHACMSQIKVCCPRCVSWEGDYGQLNEHLQLCQSPGAAVVPERRGRTTERRRSIEETSPAPERHGSAASRRHSYDFRPSALAGVRKVDKRRSLGVDEVFRHPIILKTLLHGDDAEESFAIPTDIQIESAHDQISKSLQPKRPDRSNTIDSGNNKLILSEVSLLKEKGNAKFNKGEYKEARSFYDQALALFKDIKNLSNDERHNLASLYCNRGAAHGKERHTEEAIRDYDSAIRLAPDFAKAYTRKYKILAAKGRLGEAKIVLETAVLKVPGDKSLLEDLKMTKRILDEIEGVKKLLQLRNYGEARQAGAALMKSTDNVEAVLLSAEADASVGLIDSAMEKCAFVLKTDPTNAVGLRTKGYISLVVGHFDPACVLLAEALKLGPNNVETKELYRLARKVKNDVTEARAALANADGSRTILKKAVEFFSSSIDEASLPPKTPLMCLLRTERGETELQLTHYPAALSDAKVALELNPLSVRAWVLKTDAYIATGRSAEACTELQGVRQTWARDVSQIQAAYKRADFEAKVQQCDKELRAMISPGSTGRTGDDRLPDRLSSSDHGENSQTIPEPNLRLITRPSLEATQREKPEPNPRVTRRPSTESVHTDKIGINEKNSRSPSGKSGTNGRRSSVNSGVPTERDPRTVSNRRGSFGDQPKIRERLDGEQTKSRERRPETRSSIRGETPHRNDDGGPKPTKRPSMSEEDLRRRINMI